MTITGRSGTRDYHSTPKQGTIIKARKRIRTITHDEMIARAKREADAYFMLKPDSNTEAVATENERTRLPGIKWKISPYRKDMRSGPTRRVRPSFYAIELSRAEERRHAD